MVQEKMHGCYKCINPRSKEQTCRTTRRCVGRMGRNVSLGCRSVAKIRFDAEGSIHHTRRELRKQKKAADAHDDGFFWEAIKTVQSSIQCALQLQRLDTYTENRWQSAVLSRRFILTT
eukprot:INCI3702.1.p1 GENE.INCI3702.1~~INCI3702.1.p1  ORF type:complete len:118 (+),score=9.32 INCI3702.1:51-404(+)